VVKADQVVLGVDSGGTCSPPLGKDGPTFRSVVVEAGGRVAGIQVTDSLSLHGGLARRVQSNTIRATDAELEQFSAHSMTLDNTVARNGLVVDSDGDGVSLMGGASLDYVTVADHAANGVVVHGDATVTNAVIARNGGAGLVAGRRARLDSIAFAANAQGNYLSDEPPLPNEAKGPPAEAGQDLLHLLPNDMVGLEPPLAKYGVTRAFLLEDVPFIADYEVNGRGIVFSYEPQVARANDFDAMGRPRAHPSTLGGLDAAGLSATPPHRIVVGPGDSIQDAVDRAKPSQEIGILPGVYRESVYVDGDVVLMGVRKEGNDFVPLLRADDDLPIIDPSTTSTPHHGLFLKNPSHRSLIQGLSVRNAVTGIVVMGEGDGPLPSPTLRHLHLSGNVKGLDTDTAYGRLISSLLENNQIGVAHRAVTNWDIIENEFEGNGVDMAYSFAVLGGGNSIVRGNKFGGSVRVDVLRGRHGNQLEFIGNTFAVGPPIIGYGDGDTAVVIDGVETLPTDPPTPADTPSEHVWPASGAIDTHQDQVYAVAADFGGLGVFNKHGQSIRFAATGDDPRGVYVLRDGTALVANFGAGTLSFVAPDNTVTTIEVGVEPFGVVADEAERFAYVSISGDDALVQVDVATKTVRKRRVGIAVKPRGLAIYGEGNGKSLWVTHFNPGRRHGTPGTLAEHRAWVTVLALPQLDNPRRIELPAVSSPHFPDALPTLMQSVVIRGDRAYLPSFGATPEMPSRTKHGGRELVQFETTIQALWSVVDVSTESPLAEQSANLSAPGAPLNGPYGVTFDDRGRAYVALFGNDSILQLALTEQGPVPIRPHRAAVDLIMPPGSNPRGVAILGDRIYAVNFAAGTLATIDRHRQQMIMQAPLGPPGRDKLSEAARRGKQAFHTTFSVDSSANFWLACGSCHPDGRTDGVTWAFPNGPRSTPALASALDTLPLHFDADRDEVGDFEHTVRSLQGGFGLVDGPIPGAMEAPISGRGAWADIEAYLREGVDSPRAPSSESDVSAGHQVFTDRGCQTCHGGPWHTSSAMPETPTISGRQVQDTLHDVGTKTTRDLLGDGGFDPPSLAGLAQTAPYLHDGSAHTLHDVLSQQTHMNAGGAASPMTATEQAALTGYLLSLGAPESP
jgi:DNA-binding beta-propeller fold protein YncE